MSVQGEIEVYEPDEDDEPDECWHGVPFSEDCEDCDDEAADDEEWEDRNEWNP
jgi:hypothetical protein